MIFAFRTIIVAGLLIAPAAFAQQQTTPEPPQTPAPPTAPASPEPPMAPVPLVPDALPEAPGSNVPIAVQPTGPTAVFDTSMGQMRCKLFDKEAPNTVANFVGLAEGTKDWTDPVSKEPKHGVPLYNGTVFHRVIPGFMIQGGDPEGNGMGDPGYLFRDEIDPNLSFNVAGRLAMANSGPNTDGSQFFVTVQPYPSLDGNYTIFGQCDDPSVQVATAITEVERDSNDKPLTPVTLNKVTIVPAGQTVPIPAAPATPAAPAPSNPQ